MNTLFLCILVPVYKSRKSYVCYILRKSGYTIVESYLYRNMFFSVNTFRFLWSLVMPNDWNQYNFIVIEHLKPILDRRKIFSLISLHPCYGKRLILHAKLLHWFVLCFQLWKIKKIFVYFVTVQFQIFARYLIGLSIIPTYIVRRMSIRHCECYKSNSFNVQFIDEILISKTIP